MNPMDPKVEGGSPQGDESSSAPQTKPSKGGMPGYKVTFKRTGEQPQQPRRKAPLQKGIYKPHTEEVWGNAVDSNIAKIKEIVKNEGSSKEIEKQIWAQISQMPTGQKANHTANTLNDRTYRAILQSTEGGRSVLKALERATEQSEDKRITYYNVTDIVRAAQANRK